jgi:hypothetical protein
VRDTVTQVAFRSWGIGAADAAPKRVLLVELLYLRVVEM